MQIRPQGIMVMSKRCREEGKACLEIEDVGNTHFIDIKAATRCYTWSGGG